MNFQICVWLITRTCKYISLHGKGGFVNVIKLKDLETEIILDYSGGSKVITGVFIRGMELFATPWTVAYRVPPSMGFSRQEYWSGLPFPSSGGLPNPGMELGSPAL